MWLSTKPFFANYKSRATVELTLNFAQLFQSQVPQTPEILFSKLFALHPLCNGFSKSDLQKLFKIGHLRKLHQGEMIFAPGSEGHALYFVLSGSVEIGRDEHRIRIDAGDIIGETGAVGKVVRGSGASMQCDGELLAFFHEDLVEFGKMYPVTMCHFWMNLSTILSARLAGL